MMEFEQFKQITASQSWATIDELVQACDDADFWEAGWLAATTSMAKKARVRRLIRQVKDDDGWPAIASILITNDDGNPQRLYKQEVLFNPEDYLQTVNYWIGRAQYDMKMAEGYRDHAHKRYGVQLALPWE